MFSFNILSGKDSLPTPGAALPGRSEAIMTPGAHVVSGRPLSGPYPPGFELALFAMGCFWGAERLFWQRGGVFITAVGYAGGLTPNPTYREVCSGGTGHTEAVLVVYDPAEVAFEDLLRLFWEGHDPTQGMRQGNDRGTQYRSAIYCDDGARRDLALASRGAYQQALAASGCGPITTEIAVMPTFYFAEGEHQQYLAKNPGGYCGLGGTGISCPAPTGVQPATSTG